jgi:hypothetical protein
MSRSRTWLGATNFFGRLGRPALDEPRDEDRGNAMAAQPAPYSRRPDAAIHPKPRNQRTTPFALPAARRRPARAPSIAAC